MKKEPRSEERVKKTFEDIYQLKRKEGKNHHQKLHHNVQFFFFSLDLFFRCFMNGKIMNAKFSGERKSSSALNF
jgi:hypothetical protein